jgi:hypothetical protein
MLFILSNLRGQSTKHCIQKKKKVIEENEVSHMTCALVIIGFREWSHDFLDDAKTRIDLTILSARNEWLSEIDVLSQSNWIRWEKERVDPQPWERRLLLGLSGCGT